eukprot:364033-Chlamydomonas_euryale.AAC.8
MVTSALPIRQQGNNVSEELRLVKRVVRPATCGDPPTLHMRVSGRRFQCPGPVPLGLADFVEVGHADCMIRVPTILLLLRPGDCTSAAVLWFAVAALGRLHAAAGRAARRLSVPGALLAVRLHCRRCGRRRALNRAVHGATRVVVIVVVETVVQIVIKALLVQQVKVVCTHPEHADAQGLAFWGGVAWRGGTGVV